LRTLSWIEELLAQMALTVALAWSSLSVGQRKHILKVISGRSESSLDIVFHLLEHYEFQSNCTFGDTSLNRGDHALGWYHAVIGCHCIIIEDNHNEAHQTYDVVGCLFQEDTVNGHVAADSTKFVR
jgi:hypothetical protein